ncbi:T9SS type A sorting domain-containing protein [uncultured Aquimarina sp.]|uniref:T9SS type A sorting domain-containing protein n=1 Tax=uncultured Aquimarina sp. TaxID=575652 RepID=UPI002632529C|nr:T9SS type A sorting domain-containing protein [uncultured Aquimarina sp.]
MRTTVLIFLGISLFLNNSKLFSQNTNLYGPENFVNISDGEGGFNGTLEGGDRFSRDHDVAGDINNDGVLDLVVGARSDDDGETDAGAVYILFMNPDGTVSTHQKISMLEGNFNETLTEGNFFGYGVAGIGDYNNDSIPDIAVSAPTQSNTALYIIHLNRDGTVKSFVKNSNIIAQGLSAIGDLNEDGRIDLVACNPGSDDGGTDRGAISILFLNEQSEIETSDIVTISSINGGFGSGLENGDSFGGREVAMLGDIDNDGNKELAVGAFQSEGGKGAIWILSLSSDNYNVISKQKITEGIGGFTDILDDEMNPNGTSGAQFGHAMASPRDLNSDGVPDLITGANQQDEGHAYILYLNSDKTVKTFTKINNTEGGFNLSLESEERFSRSISFIGDLRGDGSLAVNIGGGAGGTGTLYILFLKPCEFPQEPGFNFWNEGTTLFSNWNHNTQTVTGPLSFEQCTVKAYETDAIYVTFKESDGRCICKANDAFLDNSDELSSAFTNSCSSDNTLSIPTLSKNDLIAYPIPTGSYLRIDGLTSALEFKEIEVVDITGKSFPIKNYTMINETVEIDTQQLSKGIYFLNIYKNENTFDSIKFIKQ